MYIIVGLGNPGYQYVGTRHNIGFMAVEELAERNKISLDITKHKGICGKGTIGGEKVLLLEPQTYMNLSGESVRAAVDFYKIDPKEELIIIYDDISLDVGKLRIREKGSAGGHNGMKSIIAHLGTDEFNRIRIGIGDKPRGWDLADYVLGHFAQEDRENVEAGVLHACEAVELILKDGISAAMNQYNNKR